MNNPQIFSTANRPSLPPKDATVGVTGTVHAFLAESIARNADRVAVAFEGLELSYRELDARSNQLAHHLRALGVGPGVLVGVCCERGIDLLPGLLGILKAGGAYVPLDPAYPSDRIAYMIGDSGMRYILTQRALAPSLPPHAAELVFLDPDWPQFAVQPETAPVDSATSDDLAYVIYTSGSTGRPKGVELEHRSVVNFLESLRQVPGINPDDRLLAVTTLSFDIAGLELYLPLAVGARVVIASRALAADGRALARAIETQHITVMQATPATWRLLLEAEWHGQPTMRIFCGGETLTRELAERLLPRCAALWNLYGPTETTIWSTLHRVQSGTGPVPIGRPIAHTDIHVLDEAGKPVAPGTPGELYIGGLGLARGYHKRPELTAERFVADPFSGRPQGRMYRTGDSVRMHPDSTLEHLGRVDFQVKVRGFRIELGEIESVLDRHPAVRQAVVIAREDVPGEKTLVAYVRPAEGHAPTGRELREALKSQLPDYMVPSLFMFMDTFPLTPNGKIDRNAFPAPEADGRDVDGEYLAPRNETEERLAGIWAEVLRVKRVGVNTDFFELGGDSLKVAQVATRIRATFGVDIPLRAAFEHRTVASLTPVVASADPAELSAHELPIASVRRGETIPLTFAQERVWFLHELNPDNLAYNFQSTIALSGRLDVPALERTLGEILRRHESYRSSFPTVDGKPVQVVHPAPNYKLPVVDFSSFPEAERQAEAKNWCDGEFQLRFDLGKLPLVRWTLLKFGDREHVLVHMEHHLVHDGWSFNMFLREIVALYTAFCAQGSSPLPELAVQFAEFATWQRTWMQGPVSERQLAYWRGRFPTIPPVLDLPTKGTRPATQSFRGTSLRPEIPVDLCNALRALSRTQGSTLFMTMLAGFIALLHRYSGATDVAVGTFFANRRSPESEGLIGMILNNVVIRATLERDPSARELMTQIRDLVLEAAAHQDVPFDRVVEAVQPKRDMSMNPLFQVMFSFHDEPMPEQCLPDLDVRVTPVISNGSAKFDLGVIGIPHSAQVLGLPQGSEQDGMTMIWEHNTDLFETETIARMIEHYKALLRAMVADPEQRISHLPLVDSTEHERIVREWNRTERQYALDTTVVDLVTRQAAATPNAIAVESEGRKLSYAELESRSNQLANHLRARAVGAPKLVGICLSRSAEMLVALLGVLKTGAAYVPIDPTFPPDRQRFMIEDAEIAALVTDSASAAGLGDAVPVRVELDRDAARIAAEAPQLAATGLALPDGLAYVIYTSGSTGQPKGVEITHRSLTNLLQTMRMRPGLHTGDRFYAVTTLSFDIAGLELYLPLIVGATVIVGSRAVVTDGEQLAAQLTATGATVMQATPSTWQMLLDAGWAGARHLMALCGGEALPRALVERLLPKVRKLWNVYGPTETTIWSTVHDVQSGQGPVPIGRPIGNTQTYVLDQHLQIVPPGVIGELYIGGAGVARGYLKRPELTAERFAAHPFETDPGKRLYRTGDRARYLADGTLECLGRTDFQVKLRGFRIELGEIETALARLEGVRQAVAVVREDTPGDARLVAYVVGNRPNAVSSAELQSGLKHSLPDYMVPAAWVFLDTLPLTPNGKIDRNALPAPSITRVDRAANYLAPRNATEKMLVEIWENLLGTSPIGVRDDFFDVGGHSLLAVRLVTRIESKTGQKLSLAALLQGRTIEHVAGLLRERQPAPAQAGAFVTRQAKGRETPFFAVGSHPRYAALPPHLGAERPFHQLDVYALQTERLERGLPLYNSIEQIAEHYLPLISDACGSNPIHIGGGCEGAYVAYELATRLQAVGKEVASLLMWIPPPLAESRGFSPRRYAWYQSALRLWYLVASGSLAKAGFSAVGVMLRHERIEHAIMRALCAYAPRQRFNGRITLIRTSVSPMPAVATLNSQWEERASGGATVHVVPGNHASWLHEHIDPFVAVIKRRLEGDPSA